MIKNQGLFIGLEGVMVIVACLVLNVFHPGVCFRGISGRGEGLEDSESKEKRRTGYCGTKGGMGMKDTEIPSPRSKD